MSARRSFQSLLITESLHSSGCFYGLSRLCRSFLAFKGAARSPGAAPCCGTLLPAPPAPCPHAPLGGRQSLSWPACVSNEITSLCVLPSLTFTSRLLSDSRRFTCASLEEMGPCSCSPPPCCCSSSPGHKHEERVA